MQDKENFYSARREVLLRSIGHKILLKSRDSTLRLLPIKKIAENEYQINFENDFTFQPDSLVNTFGRLLAKDSHASDYALRVVNYSSATVTYGYAIAKNKKVEIIACLGRRQPKACCK